MIRYFISGLIFLTAFDCNAQVIDIVPLRQVSKHVVNGEGLVMDSDIYPEFIASFKNKGPGIDAGWECLGPQVQPEELSHSKSIPSYAHNRGNGTGRVNFLYQDPYSENRMFACSPTGGLFLSEDHGENWQVAGTDQLPISGVATVTVDPRDSDRWWITTGDGDDYFMFSDGVWMTEDAGQSWVQFNGGRDSLSIPISVENWNYTQSCEILALKKCGRPLLYASNKGLYRCDKGKADPEFVQWEKKIDGFIYDLEILPWKKKHIVAAGDHLYLSKNHGKTWKQLPDPEVLEKDHEFVRLSVEFTPDDPDHLYCVVTSRKAWKKREIGPASLQKLNLKTLEWTFIRELKKGMNNVIPSRARAFAVSPTNKDEVLVANVQPIFKSENGGVDFQKVAKNQMHDDIHHLLFEEDGDAIWAAHDGGVSVSRDGGFTWEDRTNGIGVANIHGLDVAQSARLQLLFGAYDTGGNLLLDNKWYHVCFGDGFENVIHDENPNLMITTRQNGGLFKTDDGGPFGIRAAARGTKVPWHSWLRSDPFNPDKIYLTGTNLMRSDDFGDNWQPILDADEFDMEWTYKIFPSETHEGTLYAYMLPSQDMNHVITRSFNADAKSEEIHWEQVKDLPVENWVTAIQPSSEDPGQFYFCYGYFRSAEKVWYFNGDDYVDVSYNLGFAIPESMIVDRESGRLYIGTSHGVFFLDDDRRKWIRMEGLPGTFVKSLVINYSTGKLLAGTFGRGVWQADLYRP